MLNKDIFEDLQNKFEWKEEKEEINFEKTQYKRNPLEKHRKVEKQKPGPKVFKKMKTVSYNIEEELANAIDEYCEENELRKSGFVKEILKDKMLELGYELK